MIDSSEKRNGWLNLQLQSRHLIERCSNNLLICNKVQVYLVQRSTAGCVRKSNRMVKCIINCLRLN